MAEKPNQQLRNPLELYRKHFGFVGVPSPGSFADQARVQILSNTIGRLDRALLSAVGKAENAFYDEADKLMHREARERLGTPHVNILPVASQVPSQRVAPAAYLGTPIFMPVTIGGYRLPFEPLVEIGGTKAIVRTPLAGFNGTVKENMGLDDYAITIRGVVLNEDSDDYPEMEVLRLRAIYESKESLDIVCPLLGLFNINRIAIENIRLPAEEGILHYQPYELTGYSDFDVELMLRDDLETLPLRNVLLQQ
jgi:hypothetical protein